MAAHCCARLWLLRPCAAVVVGPLCAVAVVGYSTALLLLERGAAGGVLLLESGERFSFSVVGGRIGGVGRGLEGTGQSSVFPYQIAL